MSIFVNDLQEAIIQLLLRDSFFESAVGDTVEQWEICG
jgi:hypothetical protein